MVVAGGRGGGMAVEEQVVAGKVAASQVAWWVAAGWAVQTAEGAAAKVAAMAEGWAAAV